MATIRHLNLTSLPISNSLNIEWRDLALCNEICPVLKSPSQLLLDEESHDNRNLLVFKSRKQTPLPFNSGDNAFWLDQT